MISSPRIQISFVLGLTLLSGIIIHSLIRKCAEIVISNIQTTHSASLRSALENHASQLRDVAENATRDKAVDPTTFEIIDAYAPIDLDQLKSQTGIHDTPPELFYDFNKEGYVVAHTLILPSDTTKQAYLASSVIGFDWIKRLEQTTQLRIASTQFEYLNKTDTPKQFRHAVQIDLPALNPKTSIPLNAFYNSASINRQFNQLYYLSMGTVCLSGLSALAILLLRTRTPNPLLPSALIKPSLDDSSYSKCAVELDGFAASLIEVERELHELNWKQESLARNLHDSVIQDLYALSLRLRYVERKSFEKLTPEAAEILKETGEGLSKSIKNLRTFIAGIESSTFGKKNPIQTIQQLCRRYSDCFNVPVQFESTIPEALELKPDQSMHLSLVAQELISNALRHAHPSEVSCQIKLKDQILILTVTNDGKGFDPQSSTIDPSGIQNCQLRASELNGHFLIESSPKTDTKSSFSFPLR